MKIAYFKDKICVPRQSIKDILTFAHESALGGQFSVSKTISSLKNAFGTRNLAMWKNIVMISILASS